MTERIARRVGWLSLLLVWGIGCMNDSVPTVQPVSQEKPLTVTLLPGLQPDAVFVANGLTVQQSQSEQSEEGTHFFSVYVGTNIGPDQPAMLGQYAIEGETVRFTPAFPLEPGLTYTAVVNSTQDTSPQLVREFAIPSAPAGEPTVVSNVFPSTDQLPQNLLKFYLHFSAPMSQGEAYQHLQLLDGEGKLVEDPFLELGEELWDETGTRLTLLFDPGRIKRGLRPREEVGPPLEPGRDYVFLISGDWPDANGQPLKTEFRKEFHVLPPDDAQPNPASWTISPPKADSVDLLEIVFAESLDHALQQRVIHVTDEVGQPLEGDIEISDRETHWHFRPATNWTSGRYAVVVETTLEDLAGNSIARPFEVVTEKQQSSPAAKTVEIPFVVNIPVN